MDKKAVTAAVVINRLASHRMRRNLCVPNYTPHNWWECDLAEFTPKGYFREYEVKLTLADFRADAKKTGRQIWRSGSRWKINERTALKHERLARADHEGPGQFWFVVPRAMLDGEVVPKWAGIIEFDGMSFCEIRPAPVLHRIKRDPAIITHARSVFYWRFWEQRKRLHR